VLLSRLFQIIPKTKEIKVMAAKEITKMISIKGRSKKAGRSPTGWIISKKTMSIKGMEKSPKTLG